MEHPIIDAREKPCPIPFVLAKKQIEEHTEDFTVLVDNEPAYQNLKKLAAASGYSAQIQQTEQGYSVVFSSDKAVHDFHDLQKPPAKSDESWVLLLKSDVIGQGEFELGRNLMRMYLYTVRTGNDYPREIIVINTGILLATEDIHTIESLKMLEDAGVVVRVCGTCLDYYHKTEALKVGTVSNMYEIAHSLHEHKKVLSW